MGMNGVGMWLTEVMNILTASPDPESSVGLYWV